MPFSNRTFTSSGKSGAVIDPQTRMTWPPDRSRTIHGAGPELLRYRHNGPDVTWQPANHVEHITVPEVRYVLDL